MYHAIQDIKQDEIICFVDKDAYPLRTQSDFLAATGIMHNSDKDYATGDKIEPPTEQNQIPAEVENIKKLIQSKNKATGINKKNISLLISRKLNALKTMGEHVI